MNRFVLAFALLAFALLSLASQPATAMLKKDVAAKHKTSSPSVSG